MPLTAVVDGQDVVAPFFDDTEWEALKSAVSRKEKTLVMPCCNAAGRLRVSKLGTKHFYHTKTADCNWKPETPEHLRAEAEILNACRDAGYSAISEKTGLDWRADVYAEKGKSKIAFEVQWSRQTLEETQERQARYKRDGITGCWFFRKPPFDSDNWQANKELPLFQILSDQASDQPFSVYAPSFHCYEEKPLHIYNFVLSLLERKIRYRSLMTPNHIQTVKVIFISEKCWKCKRTSHVFFVEKPYCSRCRHRMQERENSLPGGGAEEMHYEFRPEIISAVQKFVMSNPNKQLKIGKIKIRSSKTDERSYMSFGCFYCDALFGNVFLYEIKFREARIYNISYTAFETEVLADISFDEPHNHWCYPDSEDGFCNAPL